MSATAWALLAVAAVVAVADWGAVRRARVRVEYVCKPLTIVVLIGVALAIEPAGPHGSAVRIWFVVALVLSLAGDVFLMLPQDLFVPGLASFLLGHVAYIIGLWVDGTSAGAVAVGAVVVLAAMVAIGRPVVLAVRRGDEPALTAPVVAYMLVISVMVASAIGTGEAVAIVGALLFYCSDAQIAWTRFVRDKPWGRLAIIVTYHAAQAALVLSVAV